MRCRGPVGASLLDTLLAILLGSLLLTAVLRLLVGVQGGTLALTARSDRLQAIRLAQAVARMDGPGRAGGEEGGILEVRAFRGTGVVCPGLGGLVVVRGVRLPDPDKDSVRILGGDGRWRAHRLLSAEDRAGLDCLVSGPGRLQRWTVEPEPEPGWVAGRYFERGSYHLTDGALRYRRGRGGRQPLTPELLHPESRFVATAWGVRAELRFRAARGGAGTVGGGAGRVWPVVVPSR